MERPDLSSSRASSGVGFLHVKSDTWASPLMLRLVVVSSFGILVLGIIYYIRAYIRAGKYWVANTDYQVFYAAAVAVRHHANPFVATMGWIHQYSPHHHVGMAFATKSYVYPPFFAFLQMPLSFLPLRPALIAWDLCNVVFLVGVIYALLRVLDIRPSLLGLFVLTIAAVLMDPVRKELFVAQVDIFLLFLVCTALWARLEAKPYLAGILLAMACAIKPPLLVWVVFLLWKREFKFAATAIVGALVLFFAPFFWLGGQVWHDQLAIFQFWSNQFLAFDHNDSPKGILVRLLTVNPVVRPLLVAPTLVTILWLAVAAAVLLLTAARIRPQPLGRDRRSLLEIGLVVPAALLVTPLTEWPYLLMLIIPLLTLYGWVRENDLRVVPARYVAIAALVVWALLTGPLTWTENHIAARMVASHSIAADLLVLLAPGYLYLLIGAFALQMYVLRYVSGEPTTMAIRRVIADAPSIASVWWRDARRAGRHPDPQATTTPTPSGSSA